MAKTQNGPVSSRLSFSQRLELHPDVVLMDINMPELNSIRATEQILEKQPQTGIIMLIMLEDNASMFNAMRTGARGYYISCISVP